MNGPIDNRASSCLSCHSTAQWVEGAGMAPTGSIKPAAVPCYFRNLSPVQPFGITPTETSCGVVAPNQRSLDYSLQLMVGVRNIAIAEANAHRGGITLFGGNLFGRERLTPDKTVIINGVPSAPVSRDERVQER